MATQPNPSFDKGQSGHKFVAAQVVQRDTANHTHSVTGHSGSQPVQGGKVVGQQISYHNIDPILLTAKQLKELEGQLRTDAADPSPHPHAAPDVVPVNHERGELGRTTGDVPVPKPKGSLDMATSLEGQTVDTHARPNNILVHHLRDIPASLQSSFWTGDPVMGPLSSLDYSRNPFYSRTNSPLAHSHGEVAWSTETGPVAGPSNYAEPVPETSHPTTTSRKRKRKPADHTKRPTPKKRMRSEAGESGKYSEEKAHEDGDGETIEGPRPCEWIRADGTRCGVLCLNPADARAHVKAHNEELFSSNNDIDDFCAWSGCDRAVPTMKSAMVNHILTHFKFKIICPQCDKRFCFRKDGLGRHMQIFCKGRHA